MKGLNLWFAFEAAHRGGTCPGCGEGSCNQYMHCPCEGCDCPIGVPDE